MPKTDLRLLAATTAALSALTPLAALAEPPDQAQTVETLRGMSIEQLAELPITSVAKRPVPLAEAPASVFVINREDIRRSGATTLPGVLRLAPNLEVAQLSGYAWSISARGFNAPAASNKLLVQIDGRSLFEPVGSSVLWQQVDIPLDTIERIEVVSGPGGSLWGANAVNGVINIITSQAGESRSVQMDVTGGDFRRTAQLQVVTPIGHDASLRIYGQGFNQGPTTPRDPGVLASDAWRGAQGGFRLDAKTFGGALTVQGDVYRNVIADDQGSLWGGDILGRYTRPLGDGSSIEAMAYYARDDRTAADLFEQRESWDLQLQHNLQPDSRNALVWGGEVRVWRETYISKDILAFRTPSTDIALGSVFAQDEFALTPKLKLTAGLKLEESSYSGFEWLPTVRLAWRFDENNLLWGAVSRSVRTPDRIERELEAPGILEPSPDFRSERLIAMEVGWRAHPSPRASFSISSYFNLYDDLRTQDLVNTPSGPMVLTANGLKGQTWGVEAWGKYEVMKNWRISVGGDVLHKSFTVKPGHVDISGMEAAGQDPSYQAQIRSELTLTSWLEVDLDTRTVGRADYGGALAYTEGDARAAIRIARGVELALDGRNLFNPRHLEANQSFESLPPRYIGRSFFAQLRVGF